MENVLPDVLLDTMEIQSPRLANNATQLVHCVQDLISLNVNHAMKDSFLMEPLVRPDALLENT